jgi:hypothetical protein
MSRRVFWRDMENAGERGRGNTKFVSKLEKKKPPRQTLGCYYSELKK